MLLLSTSTCGIAHRQEDWRLIQTIEDICKMLWSALLNSEQEVNQVTSFIPTPHHNKLDPINIWVQHTPKNHAFTIRLGLAMCYEYTKRFDQASKHEADIIELQRIGYYQPIKYHQHRRVLCNFRPELSPFPFVLHHKYQVLNKHKQINIVASHRKYYYKKKKKKYSPRHPAYAPVCTIEVQFKK